MTDPAYRKTLKLAERDLLELLRHREDVDRQIAQTRQTVIALRLKVAGDRDPRTEWQVLPGTLTEAIAWVLTAATKPIDAPTIRDRVEALGFDIASSNPLASVHSVLKRMIERGEVKEAYVKHPSGRGIEFIPRYYWWTRLDAPPGWALLTITEFRKLFAEHLKSLGAAEREPAKKRGRKRGEAK